MIVMGFGFEIIKWMFKKILTCVDYISKMNTCTELLSAQVCKEMFPTMYGVQHETLPYI